MNGFDEMLGCKSSLLSYVRSVKDGVLRFHHVTREEEASFNTCRLILIERSRGGHMSMGVYQAHIISTVITPQMNG